MEETGRREGRAGREMQLFAEHPAKKIESCRKARKESRRVRTLRMPARGRAADELTRAMRSAAQPAIPVRAAGAGCRPGAQNAPEKNRTAV